MYQSERLASTLNLSTTIFFYRWRSKLADKPDYGTISSELKTSIGFELTLENNAQCTICQQYRQWFIFF
jgi:hypothetical protein